jgi:hypothetical protein
VIFDYYYNFDKTKTTDLGYYAPLGVGIEIETGGTRVSPFVQQQQGFAGKPVPDRMPGKLAGGAVPVGI